MTLNRSTNVVMQSVPLYDTTTILIMTLLITTLHIMTIPVTLYMSHITYNNITYYIKCATLDLCFLEVKLVMSKFSYKKSHYF
jgi:hypothetical protein